MWNFNFDWLNDDDRVNDFNIKDLFNKVYYNMKNKFKKTKKSRFNYSYTLGSY